MLVSTKQAAERLCVHPSTIRRWTAAGRMRFVRIGRERAVPAEEVSRVQRERRKVSNRAEQASGHAN